jgi:hypothetical protein
MAASDRRGQEEVGIKRFDPRILDRSVIAIPLLEAISEDENQVHAVIIDVNLDYDEGREAGRKWNRDGPYETPRFSGPTGPQFSTPRTWNLE